MYSGAAFGVGIECPSSNLLFLRFVVLISDAHQFQLALAADRFLIQCLGFETGLDRIADAVMMLADHNDPPLHLLLGEDVLGAFRQKLDDWQSSIEEWEPVTRDVNFPPQ